MLGSWQAFVCAASLIIGWLAAGAFVGFWNQNYQMFINTTTTIITFLMVFLIQNSQNRDTMAIHVKLDELIVSNQDARNDVVSAEELTEQEIRTLRRHSDDLTTG